MSSRFLRFAVLFVLLLLTAQVAQPYIFRLMYSATTPKIIATGAAGEAGGRQLRLSWPIQLSSVAQLMRERCRYRKPASNYQGLDQSGRSTSASALLPDGRPDFFGNLPPLVAEK